MRYTLRFSQLEYKMWIFASVIVASVRDLRFKDIDKPNYLYI